jgi:multicomponent Na+:H+ antiporter subunit D
MDNYLIPLFVIIPLTGAFVISLLGKRLKGVPDAFSNLCTLALLSLSLVCVPAVKSAGILVYKVGGWVPPVGICMVLDGLSIFMLVIVNVISFLVTLYAIRYMEAYTSKEKFHTLLMLMLAGMNGVIISGDLFNLFVFLEIASVASYALVAFGTEKEELEASLKYMVMGAVATSLLLIGIAFIYAQTSTLNMADAARAIQANANPKVLVFIAILFLVGFGLKAALVPFHWWLPDAHPSAPAPISAMLSGLLIKTLGIYALVRIFFNVLDPSRLLPVLLFLGALSMLVGVFLAIGQWDFKRLLAYHSISQVGYIILGIGLGTPLGILGGLFHLLNHSVFKSLLFLNSGAVVYTTGTRDLQKLGGLREKMPVTGATSLIASMSIAGIPPFNGFWSKLIIIIACIQSGHPVYALAAVVASIMTLASFMKVQKYGFFGALKEQWKGIKEVPFTMALSMVILSLLCIATGLLVIPGVADLFLTPASDVLVNGKAYATMVFEAIK